MKIVCDLSVTSATHRPRKLWEPGQLFANGAAGIWLDPSNPGSMFQDEAGTVPVTAPGQPVGLITDSSKLGLDARQSATARPTLGAIPMTGRRNLSPLSEPTHAQLGTGTGVSDAAAGLAGFDGTIQFPGGTVGDRIAYRDHGVQPSVEYTLSCFVQMDDDAPPVPGTDFALVIGNVSAGAGYKTPVDLGGGLWRVARTLTSGSTNLAYTGVFKTDSHSARGFRMSGFQLEAGAALTPYQRVRSVFDITEAGVASLRHLHFDGVDDRLLTGTLDLTHTSQVTVIAAVEKLGNPASRGTVINFVDNGFRNFSLEVPMPNSINTRWLHAGVSTLREVGHVLAVSERVLYTGLSDLAAPHLVLRANGEQVAEDMSITGGGPFKSGPLCIGDYVAPTGRRFHGRLYGLIVIDRWLTPTEVTSAESWMASKAGVTI